jgi:hypothetical protein
MKKSIKQILQDLQEYHGGLGQYYESLKEKAIDERTVMMLEYLRNQEDKNSTHLTDYLHETHDKILNKWLNIVPILPSNIFCHCSKTHFTTAPLTVDDVIEIAMHYDECLIDFLSIIAQETDCSGGADIFCNLLNLIQSEEKKLVRNSQLLFDM